MSTHPRIGGRTAANRPEHSHLKRADAQKVRKSLQRRNHRQYRAFVRHRRGRFYRLLSELVKEAEAPYRCRPYGTPGRPPTNPQHVARFLLLKNVEGWSYDETYATLEVLPELARKLGFRKTVPAASTVAMLVTRVPTPYLEDLLARPTVRLVRGRTNVAGDATGVATRRYPRWFDARHGRKGRRRTFIQLPMIVATRAEWPFFLSARVTRGTRNDAPELELLLTRWTRASSWGMAPSTEATSQGRTPS